MTVKHLVYPACVLGAGLAVCQAVFTPMVYLSNLRLHEVLTGLKAAGYRVVPNTLVMPTLKELEPAFYGALFFTFTTGMGLCLAAFFAAWCRRRLFPKSRAYGVAVFAGWVLLIGWASQQGVNMAAGAAFMIIPAAVYIPAVRWIPSRPLPGGGWIFWMHVGVLAVAVLAWTPRLERGIFIDVRDFLLLSNPAGKTITDFYYRYTLYPAHLIKPLDQKLIKACRIDVSEGTLRKQIAEALVRRDLLPVSPESAHDLRVAATPATIRFFSKSSLLLQARTDAFLAEPAETLRQVSRKLDRNRFIRQFTFYSLAAAFPLGLYLFLHAACCVGLFFVKPPPLRALLAALLCLGAALACLAALQAGHAEIKDAAQVGKSLNAESWRQRRNALKAIAETGCCAPPPELAAELAKSPHVPVRYWLARAVSRAAGRRAYALLAGMIDDPHPNVACMAYYGLGHLGDRDAVALILERMDRIGHWYVQRYAYHALRRLGWKQPVPDMHASL